MGGVRTGAQSGCGCLFMANDMGNASPLLGGDDIAGAHGDVCPMARSGMGFATEFMDHGKGDDRRLDDPDMVAFRSGGCFGCRGMLTQLHACSSEAPAQRQQGEVHPCSVTARLRLWVGAGAPGWFFGSNKFLCRMCVRSIIGCVSLAMRSGRAIAEIQRKFRAHCPATVPVVAVLVPHCDQPQSSFATVAARMKHVPAFGPFVNFP